MATSVKNVSGHIHRTTAMDQTVILNRTRCTLRDLEEKHADLLREHVALKTEYNELSLNYAHAMARLWHLNAAMGR